MVGTSAASRSTTTTPETRRPRVRSQRHPHPGRRLRPRHARRQPAARHTAGGVACPPSPPSPASGWSAASRWDRSPAPSRAPAIPASPTPADAAAWPRPTTRRSSSWSPSRSSAPANAPPRPACSGMPPMRDPLATELSLLDDAALANRLWQSSETTRFAAAEAMRAAPGKVGNDRRNTGDPQARRKGLMTPRIVRSARCAGGWLSWISAPRVRRSSWPRINGPEPTSPPRRPQPRTRDEPLRPAPDARQSGGIPAAHARSRVRVAGVQIPSGRGGPARPAPPPEGVPPSGLSSPPATGRPR